MLALNNISRQGWRQGSKLVWDPGNIGKTKTGERTIKNYNRVKQREWCRWKCMYRGKTGCGSVALWHTQHQLHLESFCLSLNTDIISRMRNIIISLSSLIELILLTRIQQSDTLPLWSIPGGMFVFDWISLEQLAITGPGPDSAQPWS